MKKLLTILLCLISAVVFSQTTYPLTQSIGSSATLVRVPVNGGLQAVLVATPFADTTAANAVPYVKYTAGAMIRTTSDGRFWKRNEAKNTWVGADGSRINFFEFLTDSSLVICYDDGSCDTVDFNNNNVFVTVNNQFGGCNNLLSGGIVTANDPNNTLVFDVTAADYTINCIQYNTSDDQVTLSDGDATFDRFDLVIVDTNEVVSVIEGTPSSDPQVPQIDHSSQLVLTTFLVPAGATTANDLGITQTVIYDQNLGTPTEWDGAEVSWTSDRDNTSFPFHLTKTYLLSGTATQAASQFSFTTTDTMRNGQFDVFKFYIRLTDAWATGQGLDIAFYHGTTKVTNSVIFTNNSYGFDQTITGSYQIISIPMAQFNFTDSIYFSVVVKPLFSPFISSQAFRLDWIQLQGGIFQALGGSSGLYWWNQYSVPQPANGWVTGNLRLEGQFQSPQRISGNTFYQGSLKVGGFAIGNGTEATAVGEYARVNAPLANASGAVAIGSQALSEGGIAIGGYSSSGNFTNIAIGGSTAGATSSLVISRDGVVSGNQSMGFGQTVSVTHNNSIVFGYLAQSTAANQFIVGSNQGSNIINSFYLGSVGVSGTEATDVAWRISGESGTNIAGHALNIGAGAGTGNATTGSVINFQTSDATGSGTTLQTLSTKASIDNSLGLYVSGIRLQGDMGATVSSANDLTLGLDGNMFHVSGATQINAITTANWQNGATITLIFDGAPLVKNNTAGGAGTATILLAGRTDFQAAAGDVLELEYDGTNWYETNRSLAAASGLSAANNGLSVSGVTVQFGQAIGAVGNPAILLSHREIPLDDFTINFNADASQTNNMMVWNNSGAAIRARITEAAEFSNTGGQSGSEVFGDGATVTSTNSVAIGNGALASNTETIAIGRDAQALGQSGIAIGDGAIASSGNACVTIGDASSSSSSGTTIVGSSTTASGGGRHTLMGNGVTSTSPSSVGIGWGVTLAGGTNIAIGEQANVAHSYSQGYGFGATTTAANQVVFGSNQSAGSFGGANDIFWGEGVLTPSPNDVSLNANSGSGTNIAGGLMYSNASRGTGTGQPGSHIIQTSVPGASGTTIQTLGARQAIIGNYTTLTEATATSFTRVNVPTGTVAGGTVVVTVEANDATDYQARTLRLVWSAVNVGGTTTITISTPEEVVAVSSGTLTVTITAVDAGSGNIDFKADATSSLTQTTLRANCMVTKNMGTGSIIAQ